MRSCSHNNSWYNNILVCTAAELQFSSPCVRKLCKTGHPASWEEGEIARLEMNNVGVSVVGSGPGKMGAPELVLGFAWKVKVCERVRKKGRWIFQRQASQNWSMRISQLIENLICNSSLLSFFVPQLKKTFHHIRRSMRWRKHLIYFVNIIPDIIQSMLHWFITQPSHYLGIQFDIFRQNGLYKFSCNL